MNEKIQELINRIKELQEELDAEFEQRRAQFQFRIEKRKIRFEQEVLAQHARFKVGLLRYVREAQLRNIVTAPIIYGMLPALLMIDLAVTFYQWTCFPLYRMPRVKRADYFVYDRANLAFLNILEKVNCAYCSYANGLASYVKEVIARTEQYWCPIKHARRILDAHSRYSHFVEFGDAAAFRAELVRLREDFPQDKPKVV